MAPNLIDAYSKSTGVKRVVPAAWLDRKDPPFDDLTKTPSQKAREAAKAETTNPATPDPKE
ncbi:hypothetical protein SAMN04487912_102350 [Arthrobacter sp. cf158]|uniref:hypothetical protein n=1 Tax=Arthrobacter sp. cf158 TaxID=1761744 RepID=UPI00089B68D5|nr:hypothetical protein [Arthrobacter sp. cf158]SDW32987.1 hypothetical protein SAMN04487912_102350 [Arthrobacter sp. cf158]